MKMTNDHYNRLKQAIIEVVASKGHELILRHKQSLAKNPSVKDLHTRFRWDLLWCVPQETRQPLVDNIYQYCNDTHIDTALKYIVNALSL